MRIDVLPNPVADIQESGSQRPENDPEQGGGTFLAIIAPMTVTACSGEAKNTQSPRRTAQKDHSDGQTSCAQLLPGTRANSENPDAPTPILPAEAQAELATPKPHDETGERCSQASAALLFQPGEAACGLIQPPESVPIPAASASETSAAGIQAAADILAPSIIESGLPPPPSSRAHAGISDAVSEMEPALGTMAIEVKSGAERSAGASLQGWIADEAESRRASGIDAETQFALLPAADPRTVRSIEEPAAGEPAVNSSGSETDDLAVNADSSRLPSSALPARGIPDSGCGSIAGSAPAVAASLAENERAGAARSAATKNDAQGAFLSIADSYAATNHADASRSAASTEHSRGAFQYSDEEPLPDSAAIPPDGAPLASGEPDLQPAAGQIAAIADGAQMDALESAARLIDDGASSLRILFTPVAGPLRASGQAMAYRESPVAAIYGPPAFQFVAALSPMIAWANNEVNPKAVSSAAASDVPLQPDAALSADLSIPPVEEPTGPIGSVRELEVPTPMSAHEDDSVPAATPDSDTEVKAAVLAAAGQRLKSGAILGEMNPNPALLQQAPSFQAANRRDPIIRSPEARRPSLESAIGSQQTTLEPTPDSFLQNEDNTSENMTGSRHRLRAADNSPVPESSAGGSSAQMDAAESALMDMRNSRCLPGCGLPSRSGTEGSAFAGLRTFQHPESVSSTSWSAPAQNPLQAASEELKTLLALLAPKSSGSGQTADFLSQLVGRIHAQLLNHESIIRVQLRPANLGRMEIKAETSSAGLQATIITESSSIKDYLESNLPLLQQNFQDQGLKVDRIQVAVQQDPLSQQSSSGSQESSSGANRNGSSGFATGRAGRQEQAEDELVLDQAALAAMNPHSTFHAIA